MTEEEIMIRAREAYIATFTPSWMDDKRAAQIRAGKAADVERALEHWGILRALRDLSKPLSELLPEDPDLEVARKIAASENQSTPYAADGSDDDILVTVALAAIKRGRELASGQVG